jgi:hypothetical protein
LPEAVFDEDILMLAEHEHNPLLSVPTCRKGSTMKNMKKRIAGAFYAVVLLATFYELFRMRHFDWDGFAEDMFEHPEMFGAPTVTPDSHPVNTHRAGKDQ